MAGSCSSYQHEDVLYCKKLHPPLIWGDSSHQLTKVGSRSDPVHFSKLVDQMCLIIKVQMRADVQYRRSLGYHPFCLCNPALKVIGGWCRLIVLPELPNEGKSVHPGQGLQVFKRDQIRNMRGKVGLDSLDSARFTKLAWRPAGSISSIPKDSNSSINIFSDNPESCS